MSADWPVVLLLSVLPAVVLAAAFRRTWADGQLTLAAAGGGVAGAIAAVGLKYALYPGLQSFLGIDLRTALADSSSWLVQAAISIFLVGAIEEGAKLGGTLGILTWIGGLHRPPAAYLGCLAAGLGFSILENLDYYAQFGQATLLLRSLVSTTGHLVFSGLIGVTLGGALHWSQRRPMAGYLLLLGGYGAGMTCHGMFNLVAMTADPGVALPVLAGVLVVGLVLMYEGWHALLRLDRADGTAAWTCVRCGEPDEGPGRFCRKCGERQPRG